MPRRRHLSAQKIPSGGEPLERRSRRVQRKPQFSGRVVTVLVGTEHVPFHIHQDLLSTSTYFSNIINGPWKESQSGISIEHIHPEIFEVYITWIYTNEVVPSDDEDDTHTDDLFIYLHYTYVFADYVQDQAFRDAVLEKIVRLVKARKSYPHHLADLVYQQTVDTSPWRRLYIDLWLCSMDDNSGVMNPHWEDVKNGPKGFFIDLLCRQQSALFERKEAEKGLDYVEKRRGSGRTRRVEPPVLSYRRWLM